MRLGFHTARFSEPVLHAQAVFRDALDAMARPGTVRELASEAVSSLSKLPCHSATAALLLALADPDTPVHLGLGDEDNAVLAQWLAFHCGAPITDQPADAAFVVIPLGALDAERLQTYALGEPDYPDRSTTVLCEVERLASAEPEDTDAARLSGPGIRTSAGLLVEPDASRFWQAMRTNHARFPLGVDVFLTAGSRIAGLPRSTRIASTAPEMAEAS